MILHLLLNELAEQNTVAPYISWERVAYPLEHFRRCVSNGATIGECFMLLRSLEHFRKSKVDQLDTAFLVNHDVLWFDVPIDNVKPLQSLKSAQSLARIKLDPLFLVVFA